MSNWGPTPLWNAIVGNVRDTPGKSSGLSTQGSVRAILHLHISKNPNATTTRLLYGRKELKWQWQPTPSICTHRGIDPRYARRTSCAKVGLGERCRKSGGAEGEAGRRPRPSTGALVASPMHRNREIKRQEKIKWWKEKGFELWAKKLQPLESGYAEGFGASCSPYKQTCITKSDSISKFLFHRNLISAKCWSDKCNKNNTIKCMKNFLS